MRERMWWTRARQGCLRFVWDQRSGTSGRSYYWCLEPKFPRWETEVGFLQYTLDEKKFLLSWETAVFTLKAFKWRGQPTLESQTLHSEYWSYLEHAFMRAPSVVFARIMHTINCALGRAVNYPFLKVIEGLRGWGRGSSLRSTWVIWQGPDL